MTIRELTGGDIAKWMNVETPQVQNPRVDLLGETESGELVHLELQSTNDATMPLRMAEYCLRNNARAVLTKLNGVEASVQRILSRIGEL